MECCLDLSLSSTSSIEYLLFWDIIDNSGSDSDWSTNPLFWLFVIIDLESTYLSMNTVSVLMIYHHSVSKIH